MCEEFRSLMLAVSDHMANNSRSLEELRAPLKELGLNEIVDLVNKPELIKRYREMVDV